MHPTPAPPPIVHDLVGVQGGYCGGATGLCGVGALDEE